jgi:ligand-binding sensor domain-containing protein
LKTILLVSALALFSSSNGQHPSQDNRSTVNNQNAIIAIGDTVSEIDSCIFIIFQDKNNTFWFGSDGEGVYRTDGKTIAHYSTKDGLCNNRIRGIQEDKSQNIYLTTIDGISKFDGQSFTTLSASASGSSITEWALHPDDLWFQGAQDSGAVYRYDGTTLHRLEFPKTKSGDEFISRFARSKYPAMVYSPYDVYSIFVDSKGYVWFGTSSLGVCRYDGKSFTWIAESDLAESPVRSIVEDKNGIFWFGNSGQAVYCYDGKTLIDFRKEKGFGNSNDRGEETPVSYMSIIRDNNDDLWIVTFREGVWRYDGENRTHYPIKDGNTNIALYSIYKDKLGDLWLASPEAGVYKFNGKTFEKFGFRRLKEE